MVSGHQDASVSSHVDDGWTPVVTVQTGPVITYCHTLSAVRVQAAAWTDAARKARSVFPDGYAGPKLPTVGDDGRRDVQAIIHSRDIYTYDVTAYAPGATRERLAAVYTRVGPVQLRCLDAEAVTSTCRAWLRAENLAFAVWAEEVRENALTLTGAD
jgi:hypothetical protein